MDRFFEMVNGWTPFGQGLFFTVVLFFLCMLIVDVMKYIAVMLRGWPQDEPQEEEEE